MGPNLLFRERPRGPLAKQVCRQRHGREFEGALSGRAQMRPLHRTPVRARQLSSQVDSWVMLNLYPQRATDASEIHDEHNPELRPRTSNASLSSSMAAGSRYSPHGAS
jgi:hypothetical protein